MSFGLVTVGFPFPTSTVPSGLSARVSGIGMGETVSKTSRDPRKGCGWGYFVVRSCCEWSSHYSQTVLSEVLGTCPDGPRQWVRMDINSDRIGLTKRGTPSIDL